MVLAFEPEQSRANVVEDLHRVGGSTGPVNGGDYTADGRGPKTRPTVDDRSSRDLLRVTPDQVRHSLLRHGINGFAVHDVREVDDPFLAIGDLFERAFNRGHGTEREFGTDDDDDAVAQHEHLLAAIVVEDLGLNGLAGARRNRTPDAAGDRFGIVEHQATQRQVESRAFGSLRTRTFALYPQEQDSPGRKFIGQSSARVNSGGSANLAPVMRASGRVRAYFARAAFVPWVVWLVACGGATKTSSNSDDEFDPAMIAEDALSAHNGVRAAVSQPSNYPGTWVPLPALVWSEEVAASAQGWADNLRTNSNCRLAHEQAGPLGENVAGGYVGYSPARAVDDWAAERKNYAFAPAYVHSDVWGHYTQVVWRNSTELGCGMAFCDNGTNVIVCRYRPAGNVVGAQPY